MKHSIGRYYLMNLAAVAVLSGSAAATVAQERPTILFIMSDDHTAQAVGAYATLLKDLDPTPTIDTLASEGIAFDNAFRVQGEKPWPKNVVKHRGEHSSDAITDATLEWFKNRRDPDKPFFVCHHYKAPHGLFDNAPRYQDYLADVTIPEPDTLYDVPDTWGSIATRGHDDELMPHIGSSLGTRNPRRSHTAALSARFPGEYPEGFDHRELSEDETTRFSYQAYLRKYLRCVKGVDDNLKRLFDYLKKEGLYDLRNDPRELVNVYDDPKYAETRERLKQQLAGLRQKIGDDGSHYPACEKVVQEFWDYDDANRAKAIAISASFKKRREAQLAPARP